MTELEKRIVEVLKQLEIPTHVRGYIFLKDALTAIYTDFGKLYEVCKLYDGIASKWNTTGARVERGIRHAISLSGASDEARRRIIGPVRKLTIGAFLGGVVEYLRMEEASVDELQSNN